MHLNLILKSSNAFYFKNDNLYPICLYPKTETKQTLLPIESNPLVVVFQNRCVI